MTEYGTWGEKSMYGKKVTGVIRSTFVIDGDGVIAEALYNVRARATSPGCVGCSGSTEGGPAGQAGRPPCLPALPGQPPCERRRGQRGGAWWGRRVELALTRT